MTSLIFLCSTSQPDTLRAAHAEESNDIVISRIPPIFRHIDPDSQEHRKNYEYFIAQEKRRGSKQASRGHSH